ncbi:hypothetical protein H8S23_05555 [Anaerofilum sp. BX8]|uniref:YDG domain-containing protein n=1 Tax=Anaerofilum hominis TaxID=2763016 RepID=A0A923I8A8_9FIRM|nr:YDG domain-containing protein [Anaerofilum hominis]MBC5580964.1 hypothetical protein [Anaerofilum hominis]
MKKKVLCLGAALLLSFSLLLEGFAAPLSLADADASSGDTAFSDAENGPAPVFSPLPEASPAMSGPTASPPETSPSPPPDGSQTVPPGENTLPGGETAARCEVCGGLLADGVCPVCSAPAVFLSETDAADEDRLVLTPGLPSGALQEDGSYRLGYTYSLRFDLDLQQMTAPSLRILLPDTVQLQDYPRQDDSTLGSNFTSVTVETDGDTGSTALTYCFSSTATKIGFEVFLTPLYQIADKELFTVDAQLCEGDAVTAEKSHSLTAYNWTVREPTLYGSASLSGTLYPGVPCDLNFKPYFYLPAHSPELSAPFYPLTGVTYTVPLHDAALPGTGTGDAFVPLADGQTYTADGVRYSYLSSYEYAPGKTCKALRYTLDKDLSQLVPSFSNSSGTCFTYMPALTIRLEAKDLPDLTITSRTYRSPEGSYLQITAPHDGGTVTLSKGQSSSSFSLKLYDLSQDYDVTASYSATLLPSSTGYAYCSPVNRTSFAMRDAVLAAQIAPEISCQRLELVLPWELGLGEVTLQYTTRKQPDPTEPQPLTALDEAVVLPPGDSFTGYTLRFQRLPGNSMLTSSNCCVRAYVHSDAGNGLNGAYRNIVSSLSFASLEGSDHIPVKKSSTSFFYIYDQITAPLQLGAGALENLKIGSSFYLEAQVVPSGSSAQDQEFYLVMPSGYLFSGLTSPGGHYQLTTSPWSEGQTLYALRYQGNSASDGRGYVRFNFTVGPAVDTGGGPVQLPTAFYGKNNHPEYPTAAGADTVAAGPLTADFNGDGTPEERDDLFACTKKFSLTFQYMQALSFSAYLTSTNGNTTGAAGDYRYCDEGVYRVYVSNSLQKAQTLSELTLTIPLPRAGTAKSAFDVVLTGEADVEGTLWDGVQKLYSTDNGATYGPAPAPDLLSEVTHVKLVCSGQRLVEVNQSAVAYLPFAVSFPASAKKGDVSLFAAQLSYSLGDTPVSAALPACTLSAVPAALEGRIYYDDNGNGRYDDGETVVSNNVVSLYTGAGSFLGSSFNQPYALEFVAPGSYQLRYTKRSGDRFGEGSRFSFDGNDASAAVTVTRETSLSDLTGYDLGLRRPRELSAAGVRLVEIKSPQKRLAPTVSPALAQGETLLYQSSDPSVAAVDADGVVTYVSPGQAKILITAPNTAAFSKDAPTVSLEVAVTCEPSGCLYAASPSLTLKSGSAYGPDTAEPIIIPADDAQLKLYYSAKENPGSGNYCNEAHDQLKTLSLTVADAGSTGAVLQGTASASSSGTVSLAVSSTRYLTLSDSGTVRLRLTLDNGHGVQIPAVERTLQVVKQQRVNFSLSAPSDLVYDGTSKTAQAVPSLDAVEESDYTLIYRRGGVITDPVEPGVYTVSVRVDNGAYLLGEVSGTSSFTIAKAPPVTGLPTAAAITYGSSLAASALTPPTASGLTAGTYRWKTPDTVPDAGSEAFEVLFTPDEAGRYASVTLSVPLLVRPRALLASPSAVTLKKQYDGTPTAAVSAVPLNLLDGDDLVLSASAAYNDKNVGSAKTITVTYEIDGQDAHNYTAPANAVLTGQGEITPLPLAVTGASAADRLYNGTTAVTVSGGVLSGVLPGDQVSLAGSPVGSLADADASPLPKDVTVSGYALSGADSANYLLLQPTGLTCQISKVPQSLQGASSCALDAAGDTLPVSRLGVFSTAASPGSLIYEVIQGADLLAIRGEELIILGEGTVTLRIRAPETANYLAAEKEITLTIRRVAAPAAPPAPDVPAPAPARPAAGQARNGAAPAAESRPAAGEDGDAGPAGRQEPAPSPGPAASPAPSAPTEPSPTKKMILADLLLAAGCIVLLILAFKKHRSLLFPAAAVLLSALLLVCTQGPGGWQLADLSTLPHLLLFVLSGAAFLPRRR